MTCRTCPHCGYDLERVEELRAGDLTIIGGSAVYWKGKRVRLSVSRVLVVCALSRADGAMVHNMALAEALGYEGEAISRLLDVHFCRIKQAFRTIDPTFDRIERGVGRHSGGGARWRVEN